MWHLGENFNIFNSNLNTMLDLFDYINITKNKDIVVFPNGKKCDNIPELFDFLCISYLITHSLLCKYGIFPSDMHVNNIFIYWLNEN